MTLGAGKKFDPTVMAFKPAPLYETFAPHTGFIDIFKALGLVVRAVLQSLEKRLCVGVVIAHTRSAV